MPLASRHPFHDPRGSKSLGQTLSGVRMNMVSLPSYSVDSETNPILLIEDKRYWQETKTRLPFA
jgi:hypothetical protein